MLDMARVVVDAFLPSVSQQSAGNEKRSHLHKTFSSHIESEEKWVKLHLHAYTLLLGSALAILVGIFARPLISSSRKLPDVIVFRTILYAFVLSNVLYAISVLANAPALCDHGIVFLSFSTLCVRDTFPNILELSNTNTGTLRFFLVGRAYFKQKSYFVVRSDRKAKSMTRIMSQKYRYPYSTHSALLQLVFHLCILFLQYNIGSQEDGGLFFEESLMQIGQGFMKFPQWPTLAIYTYYPCLILQLHMIWKFIRNDKTVLRSHIRVALYGIMIRISCAHVPLVLRHPYVYIPV